MTLREPTWDEARGAAHAAGSALPTEAVPLDRALGRTLAQPLIALSGVPNFDTSMMDGWAVSGDGPWTVTGRVLAGSLPAPLTSGTALEIATGAPVPQGATAVLRHEWGSAFDGILTADHELQAGEAIRRAGDEANVGDALLPAGMRVTPPVLGLAALVGVDALTVHRGVTVEVLVFGDEIVTEGLPATGKVRDALGLQVPAWTGRFGTTSLGVRYVEDTLDAHKSAIAASRADLVFTTGGTARGPVDHVHHALAQVGAKVLIDEVAVRPGHPMLLAQLQDGRFLVGLPGNPLAAVAGYLTLAEPLLYALHGAPLPTADECITEGDIEAPGSELRLMPARRTGESAIPTRFWGSAMLRGIAQSDCMLVSGQGGSRAGDRVRVLPLPW